MDELISKLRAFVKQPGPNRRLVFIMLALVALVAFVLNAFVGGSAVDESIPEPTKTLQSVQLPSFFVHVVGQVKNPGVYSLKVGARLFDAVVAAGGFMEGADQASVNLARQLTDGEQILVLKLGQTPAVGTGGGASSLISINRASELELESLPGVGPALAGRIIDWRTANGGFKKKEDLLNVGGIGDKLFAGLSKQITL
jgi:competence protein ComEA